MEVWSSVDLSDSSVVTFHLQQTENVEKRLQSVQESNVFGLKRRREPEMKRTTETAGGEKKGCLKGGDEEEEEEEVKPA